MKRVILAALTFAVAQSSWAAAEFQYFVFPVKSITGLSQSALGKQGFGPKYSGMINEKYADLFFDNSVQASLLKGFRDELSKRYPQAVVGANQIASARSGKYAYQPYEEVQCKPQFTVNYKDAFAVAIGVSRLSAYINKFGNYVDALIPVTYTLRFVKLNGADVAFSRSETIYTRYSTTAAEFFASNGQDIAPAVVEKLKNAIQSDGLGMTSRLLDFAVKGFSPKQTEISVSGRDGKFVIFNHGSEVGFKSGDWLSAFDSKQSELSYTVLYATNGIAVAEASTPESDRVRMGDKLVFQFEGPGQDDAKPTVLATQYVPGSDGKLSDGHVMNNALMAIVTDDIGFKAPFNIVKHDPDFSQLKDQIKADANCESTIFRDMHGFASNTTRPQKHPNFYLKLESFDSPMFTSWGTGRVNSKTVFSNAVNLSVVDRTGVVADAYMGNSDYVLERSAGKGLSPEEAAEVNRKNAALSAMQSFVGGFANPSKVVPIQSASKGVITLAQALPLDILKEAYLVRPVKANGKQILMPLPQDVAKIVDPMQASDRLEFKGDVKSSDLLVVSGVDPSSKKMERCVAKNGRFLDASLKNPSNADAAIAVPLLTRVRGFSLIETDKKFLESVEFNLKDGFFSDPEVTRPASAASCYLVLERQQITNQQCPGEQCAGTAVVGSGVQIFSAEAKVAESVKGGRFEFKDIAPDALSSFIGFKAYENHMGSLPVHKSKLQ